MCGIAGLIRSDNESRIDSSVLQAMLETMVHRGPDDSGIHLDRNLGIGMRRLAIIDLEGGRQPMANEDRSVWVVCNGEIYNFAELRKELEAVGHRFRTSSDTEVIVHAYEEFGQEFPRRLNGMFAVAVWNSTDRVLTLARDRMGIKPLYFGEWDGRFAFASETKALLAAGLPRRVDATALHHYLSLNYVPAPHCIWEGVRKVLPGHTLVWKDGRWTTNAYWRLDHLSSSSSMTEDEAAEQILDLLDRSVRRRLISDVPLGLFLSGGVDSAALACLMAKHSSRKIKTFTIDFQDPSYSEAKEARDLADRLGAEHHEMQVDVKPAEMLPLIAEHCDEPFADSSAIPVYYVSRMAREEVTVALGGDGGDEVFAGYETHAAYKWGKLYRMLPSFLARGALPALLKHIPTGEGKITRRYMAQRFVEAAAEPPELAHFLWKVILREGEKAKLYAEDYRQTLPRTSSIFLGVHQRLHHADPVNRLLGVDTCVYLPDDILTKVDRMSMAVSLEARVPFLDHELLEFAWSLPGHMKLKGLKKKHILKKALKDLLPPSVLRRRKRGFNVPMAGWLRRELAPALDEHLAPSRQQALGFFDTESVASLRREHTEGRRDRSRELWGLLVFSLWHSRHVEGRM